MKKNSLLLFFFCTIVVESYAQENPSQEAGKCYAKCNSGVSYTIETFAEYLGDKRVGSIEEYTIDLEPNQTIEKKKGVKSKCYDPSSEDCFLWETIDISDEESVTFWIVADTSVVKNFKMTTLKITKSKGIEWREVLCESNCTPTVIEEIYQKLTALGYYCGKQKSLISSDFKNALIKYQIKNNLPVGQLNIETLNQLKITYKK
jgi:hypothetical protein